MQFDAIETRLTRPARRRGKKAGQDVGQIADMRQVSIGHPLAIAHGQGFPLARRQRVHQGILIKGFERRAHHFLGRIPQPQGVAVAVGDG